MDKYPDQKRAVQYLYPPVDPFDQRMLAVGQGHQIYIEQCGNPDAAPRCGAISIRRSIG
jgi:proline iminopeptidase